MIKYLKITWIVFRNAYIRDSKIPGQIFSKILFNILEIATTIIFFNVIFSNTQTLGGWNFYQVLFLYAFAKIVISINNGWAQGGLRTFASELVRRGDYDFYLTKPVNPMILVSLSKPRIYQFIAVFFEIGLCVYAIIAGHIDIGILGLFWFLILAIFGVVLYYFLSVLTVLPAFWFIKIWALQDLMGRLSQVMRYPAGVFPPIIKIALMSAFPIIAVSFVPVTVLFGQVKIEYIVYMIVTTIAFGIIINFFWKKGQERYSSASS